jgi:hypothetical protein
MDTKNSRRTVCDMSTDISLYVGLIGATLKDVAIICNLSAPTGLGEDGSDWHQDRWHGQPGQRES